MKKSAVFRRGMARLLVAQLERGHRSGALRRNEVQTCSGKASSRETAQAKTPFAPEIVRRRS
jgi:hypothetical protein